MVMDDKRGVKGGLDKDDCRKNRAAQKVELRKAKRDEGLQKRRNMQLVTVEPNEVGVDVSDPATPENGAAQSFATQCTAALGFVARNGPAEEYDTALVAVRGLRKQLSLARNPPIDDVIAAGLVPAFVTMLGHPESKLQFEAAWCLTNIASGTSKQCEVVVQNNGVPPLVGLMGSSNIDVCEQAVWAIGNIAGDCAQMRDLVLANGATERVLKLVEVRAFVLPPLPVEGHRCRAPRGGPRLNGPRERAAVPRTVRRTIRACLTCTRPSIVRAGDRVDGADGPAAQRRVGAVQPDAWQAAARRRARRPGGADAREAADDRRRRGDHGHVLGALVRHRRRRRPHRHGLQRGRRAAAHEHPSHQRRHEDAHAGARAPRPRHPVAPQQPHLNRRQRVVSDVRAPPFVSRRHRRFARCATS
jgi:hypothetical protein